ncbi:MAG: phosphoribosylamine--glycine ligase [Candidatus Caldatribacterium sp.]|nr:phosphoribosylamine--glycine ligase [Candidatus Caldatribacterium sp.]
MRVLVVGSGGREHCIAWKVAQSPEVKEIFCVPGNGGMELLGKCISLSSLQEIVDFVEEKDIDLVLVGPEAPLAAGIVDCLCAKRRAVIGPDRRGALLESSKVFAKEFMKRYGIPTAPFSVFGEPGEALEALKRRRSFPVVVKADGLASGKGVYVAQDFDEASFAVRELMVEKKFGSSGERIVVEDFLEGEEATVMVLFDGQSYLFLPSSQDHKKVGEGDIGPNTGGMGAYSPAPVVDDAVLQRIEREILIPLFEGMERENLYYRGVLYLGLMIGKDKTPWVLEFNVRLGDPETQVVLPRIRNDWLEVNLAIWEGKLHRVKMEISEEAMLGVVLASQGYPGHFERGKRIKGIENFANRPEDRVLLFHSGTIRKGDEWYTDGGRVLTVCAFGKNLEEAHRRAYEAASSIHFEGMYYRRDIGFRVLKPKGPS